MPRISVRMRSHKGRFCKTIGIAIGRNGKPTRKVFYFPPNDPATAFRRILELQGEWRRLRSAGLTVWEESPLYQAEYGQVAAAVQSQAKPLTVRDAVLLYLGGIEKRMIAGQCSRAHYTSQKHRLEKATKTIQDVPLTVVDGIYLQEVVLHLASRPLVNRGRGKAKWKMSANYARATIATLRWFFSWCDDAGYWTAPRGIKSIFKARPVLSAAEQDSQLSEASEVEHFTLDEIKLLWAAASDLQRTLILLALNCGFANMECSTLRTSEVKGKTIERFRRKTVKTAGKGSYTPDNIRLVIWAVNQVISNFGLPLFMFIADAATKYGEREIFLGEVAIEDRMRDLSDDQPTIDPGRIYTPEEEAANEELRAKFRSFLQSFKLKGPTMKLPEPPKDE